MSEQIKNLIRNIFEEDNKSDFKFRVRENCLPFLTKYVPYSYIASGQYGVVFQVCENISGKQPDCKYVIKVLHPVFGNKVKEIEKEMHMSTIFGEPFKNLPPVGPKVIATFSCNGQVNYGDNEWNETPLYFIVMEKMDMTLHKYIESYPSEYEKEKNYVTQKIIDLNKNLEIRGYLDTDLHHKNIMVNIDNGNNITDIKFIDFGIIVAIEPEEEKTIGRFQVRDDEEDDEKTPKQTTVGRFQGRDEEDDEEAPKQKTVGRFHIREEDEDDDEKPINPSKQETIGRFQVSEVDVDEKEQYRQKMKLRLKRYNKYKMKPYNPLLSTIKEQFPYY